MNTPLMRSGMTRILKESHSFTCTPCVHPLTNEPYLPFQDCAQARDFISTAVKMTNYCKRTQQTAA